MSDYSALEPRSLGFDLSQQQVESSVQWVDLRNQFSKKQSPDQCWKDYQHLTKSTTQTREEQGLQANELIRDEKAKH